MIGWLIIVSLPIAEGSDRQVVARWEAGADGIRWLEHLVQTGKASKLTKDGYPNRYTSSAGDVRQVVETNCPENLLPSSTSADLLIDAWDQS